MRFSMLSQMFTGILIMIVAVGCGTSDTFNRAQTRGANINSMIAITNVASALETYRLDHGEYPSADSMDELKSVLNAYLGEERGVDRWGEHLIVTVTPDAYTLTSKGDDRVGGHEDGGAVETAGHSITLADGIFVQYHSSVEAIAQEYEAQIADTRSPAKTDA